MSLNSLARRINTISIDHGFWDAERNMGEMLMLAVSELAEALEEHRSEKPVIYFVDSKPEGVAVELADCIIRCLDTLYSLNVDIDAVVEGKINYNKSRPYKHGKAY